jgi:hypothetical protein
MFPGLRPQDVCAPLKDSVRQNIFLAASFLCSVPSVSASAVQLPGALLQFACLIPAHSCDQPAPLEFGTGFLLPETDAQKGAGDDVSKQRPEIGDRHSREMAAKAAFSFGDLDAWVSGDWVVGAPGLGPVNRPKSKSLGIGTPQQIDLLPQHQNLRLEHCARPRQIDHCPSLHKSNI